jgi:hypothetical protein
MDEELLHGQDRFHPKSVPFIRPAIRGWKFEQDQKIIVFGWGLSS